VGFNGDGHISKSFFIETLPFLIPPFITPLFMMPMSHFKTCTKASANKFVIGFSSITSCHKSTSILYSGLLRLSNAFSLLIFNKSIISLDRVLKYFDCDKDVRGYVEDKGWAHSAAHGADALDEFARCEEIGYEGLKKILDAVYKKVNINHYGYIHFEDERMITAVKAILEREVIPTEEIEDWVKSFSKIEKIGKYPEDLVVKVNVNTFLKSLYFRLIDNSQHEQITNVIRKVLGEINPFSKY